jgi:hypothetical protein
MERNLFKIVVVIATLLIAGLSWAGGPVCKVPACGPQPCAPMMCAPQPCMPQQCMPACPPPPCGPICPPMACGPAPCPPPACGPAPCAAPGCEENPLAQIVKGACRLVAGIVALPFKIVDGVFSGFDCGPRRYASCKPIAMCAPPPCMPAICPPTICPPTGCGVGFSRPAPVGFGFGGPRMKKFSPFAKKDSVTTTLIAAPTEGFFGSYW